MLRLRHWALPESIREDSLMQVMFTRKRVPLLSRWLSRTMMAALANNNSAFWWALPQDSSSSLIDPASLKTLEQVHEEEAREPDAIKVSGLAPAETNGDDRA